MHETSESFRERTLLQIEFEDDIEAVTPQRLSRLLADAPSGKPEQHTRDFGTQWLREQRSLGLLVPSIVMPYEQNVIINPAHPRATSLRVHHRDIITIDQRLVRALGAATDAKQGAWGNRATAPMQGPRTYTPGMDADHCDTCIELLYVDECPSYKRVWGDLLDVISESGMDACVRLSRVNSAEEAAFRGFAGSPTVLVNGRDLEGYDGPGALACRTYAENDGNNWPSMHLLRQAIVEPRDA